MNTQILDHIKGILFIATLIIMVLMPCQNLVTIMMSNLIKVDTFYNNSNTQNPLAFKQAFRPTIHQPSYKITNYHMNHDLIRYSLVPYTKEEFDFEIKSGKMKKLDSLSLLSMMIPANCNNVGRFQKLINSIKNNLKV